MSNKTFKQLIQGQETKVIKEIKKAGLSLAIIFSKEDLKKFNLKYGDQICLDNAEILKNIENEQEKIVE